VTEVSALYGRLICGWLGVVVARVAAATLSGSAAWTGAVFILLFAGVF